MVIHHLKRKLCQRQQPPRDANLLFETFSYEKRSMSYTMSNISLDIIVLIIRGWFFLEQQQHVCNEDDVITSFPSISAHRKIMHLRNNKKGLSKLYNDSGRVEIRHPTAVALYVLLWLPCLIIRGGDDYYYMVSHVLHIHVLLLSKKKPDIPSISPYKCTMAVEEILRPYYCHRGNIICVCIQHMSVYIINKQKGCICVYIFRNIYKPKEIINVLSVCKEIW